MRYNIHVSRIDLVGETEDAHIEGSILLNWYVSSGSCLPLPSSSELTVQKRIDNFPYVSNRSIALLLFVICKRECR